MKAKKREQEEQGGELLEKDGSLIFTVLGLLSLERVMLAQNSMSATF